MVCKRGEIQQAASHMTNEESSPHLFMATWSCHLEMIKGDCLIRKCKIGPVPVTRDGNKWTGRRLRRCCWDTFFPPLVQLQMVLIHRYTECQLLFICGLWRGNASEVRFYALKSRSCTFKDGKRAETSGSQVMKLIKRKSICNPVHFDIMTFSWTIHIWSPEWLMEMGCVVPH